MDGQRYVSGELTHFAGRSLRTEDDRFEVLVTILKTGQLRAPRNPDGSKKEGMTVHANAGAFCDRQIHEVPAVCFCDIPERDFSIHMKKYSRFGLAFTKAFLLGKGATPVAYVATDSFIDYKPNVDWASRTFAAGPVAREDFLNSLINAFYWRRLQLSFLLVNQHQEGTPEDKKVPPSAYALLMEIEMLMQGIDREFLSYCVPFRASLMDADDDNFYMEREWRTPDDVEFSPSDVCRVILPQKWAARLRSALPDYCGQVTFSR